MRSRLLLRRLLSWRDELMAFRQAGEPASRPIFNAGISSATPVGPAVGGVLYVVRVANKSASPLNCTVSDSTAQFDSIEVPANDTKSATYGATGAKYTGQLSVTPSAAADVTVVLL